MRLLIMGAPGAGKGTQATRISERYGIATISTGAIFRANLAAGTPLGLKVKAIMDAGDYVPDEVTEEIVADRLREDDVAQGWLLDGFPRTPHQVDALDAFLTEQGQSLDAVVSLVVDSDLLVERLLGRGASEGRSDDTADTIRNRMNVFLAETEPLLAHYRERGLLIEVDGVGTVDEVTDRIVEALDGALGAVNADHE